MAKIKTIDFMGDIVVLSFNDGTQVMVEKFPRGFEVIQKRSDNKILLHQDNFGDGDKTVEVV